MGWGKRFWQTEWKLSRMSWLVGMMGEGATRGRMGEVGQGGYKLKLTVGPRTATRFRDKGEGLGKRKMGAGEWRAVDCILTCSSV
jgi:hypothetical protein